MRESWGRMKEQCSGVKLLGDQHYLGGGQHPTCSRLTPVMNYISGDAQVIWCTKMELSLAMFKASTFLPLHYYLSNPSALLLVPGKFVIPNRGYELVICFPSCWWRWQDCSWSVWLEELMWWPGWDPSILWDPFLAGAVPFIGGVVRFG